MRKISFIYGLIIMFSCAVVHAQMISKKSLLNSLSDTGISTISSSQKKGMDDLNSNLVSDLYKIESKKQSKSEREIAIDQLFDKRDKDVDSLFGNDSNYIKKYKKEYRKKSRSLRMKIKLARLVL
ncbi:hypothetical protein [Flavobacterium sp. TSSA_36]|uniref:hypothetical protein n=1 Tax=Flavobacterium sp. TSSA_36 TaxID=3447669 RepID=UPI003F2A2DDD